MAIEVHSAPPERLNCGDVYKWKDTPEQIDSVTSYDVIFRSEENPDVSFIVSGTDQTTFWEFTLAGATTDILDSGEYLITKSVTYSWGRESEDAGKVFLLPNPTATPGKTFNARMVELLECHIEGRLPEGLESHTIGGVPISKIPLLDAQRLLSDYKSRLEYERNRTFKERNPEKASGNTIHLHF